MKSSGHLTLHIRWKDGPVPRDGSVLWVLPGLAPEGRRVDFGYKLVDGSPSALYIGPASSVGTSKSSGTIELPTMPATLREPLNVLVTLGDSLLATMTEGFPMGIFDSLKDKATELLSGATDKVTEATGIDLSGATDKLAETTGVDLGGVTDQAGQAADGLTETAQGHADAFGDQVTETTGIDLPTENLTDQATDKFNEATGR